MRQIAVLCLLIVAMVFFQRPLTGYMQNKPLAEKVGFIASPKILRLVAADQREILGAAIALKSLFYYGTLIEEAKKDRRIPVDYDGLQRMVKAAVSLDPYNMDSYYFAQAILVWDGGQVEEVNSLLDYGMLYRDWDWMLPFWAGFNSAHFLKDYKLSAEYYRKAGELSGSHLFVKLSSRYLYETGQTELAVAYLEMMVKGSRTAAIKETFQVRLDAFRQVRRIENALSKFRQRESLAAPGVGDLIKAGFLQEIPIDPYGGEFFIDNKGKVHTTSKFSYALGKKRTD